MAVFLTLTGCSEQFRRMEQNIQPVMKTLDVVRHEQMQLKNRTQSENSHFASQIGGLEGSQRSLQEGMAKIGDALGKEHKVLFKGPPSHNIPEVEDLGLQADGFGDLGAN